MILPLAYYGNPILRKKGSRIEKITPEIEKLIEDMVDTMNENRGIGLAAQQIGEALQLTVIDIRPAEDRPSTLELDGKDSDPNSIMPLILLNPEIEPLSEEIMGPEGCLSFPEIYADIGRPEKIRVTSLNEEGKTISFVCGGLLSRCIQHETDHLHGILFTDRMDRKTKADIREELERLQSDTKAELANEEN